MLRLENNIVLALACSSFIVATMVVFFVARLLSGFGTVVWLAFGFPNSVASLEGNGGRSARAGPRKTRCEHLLLLFGGSDLAVACPTPSTTSASVSMTVRAFCHGLGSGNIMLHSLEAAVSGRLHLGSTIWLLVKLMDGLDPGVWLLTMSICPRPTPGCCCWGVCNLFSCRAVGHAELDSKPAAIRDRDDTDKEVNEVPGLVDELLPGLSVSRAGNLDVGTDCHRSLSKPISSVLAPFSMKSSNTDGSCMSATNVGPASTIGLEGSGSTVLDEFFLCSEGEVRLDFQVDHTCEGVEPLRLPCFRASGLQLGVRRAVPNRRGAPPTLNVLRSGRLGAGILQPHPA